MRVKLGDRRNASDLLRYRIDEACDRERTPRRLVVDTPMGSTVCALALAGIGVMIVYRFNGGLNLHLGVVVRPLALKVNCDLATALPPGCRGGEFEHPVQ